jgi:hypothetical protein
MPVDANAIRERWNRIRKNPKCDVALDPKSIAKNLRKPEHELVQERIQESLNQLARYRVSTKSFQGTRPAGTGDLVTCEGLESFLVPAVYGALSFGAFIEGFNGSAKEQQDFVAGIVADINNLIESWEKGQFSGQPYSDENKILQSLPPATREKLRRKINITEAAAMACRVLVHLLTLKLNPPLEERRTSAFRRLVGDKLNDDRMFAALGKAIDFLVQAFQKGQGRTEEERIANSQSGGDPGSGWSWTDRAGLPPMLFFSAAAVDAFAELDLYLIRKAEDRTPDGKRKWEIAGTNGQRRLLEFYDGHKTNLELYQLCVDMTRLWVRTAALADISVGLGQHTEPDVRYFIDDEAKYQEYRNDLAREELKYSPLVFYNNLYALQILFWSWADWDEEGTSPDDDAKNKFNRALAQVVYNYDRIPVVRQVLSNFSNQFYLPGTGFFVKEAEERCTYLDAGFLPLLTRLLVLSVVYGRGDRNVLEPVIHDLYVELLQNRNRANPDYSALWSEKDVQVSSTQRAIQALTFYYAYARGKELVMPGGAPGGVANAEGLDLIAFRNKTGRPLFLVAASEEEVAPPPPPPARPAEPPTVRFTARTLAEYSREHNIQPAADLFKLSEEERDLVVRANQLGNEVIRSIENGGISDILAAKLILNGVARIVGQPALHGALREPELVLLTQQYNYLKPERAEEQASG